METGVSEEYPDGLKAGTSEPIDVHMEDRSVCSGSTDENPEENPSGLFSEDDSSSCGDLKASLLSDEEGHESSALSDLDLGNQPTEPFEWRPIDDFCLLANVLHFNDIKMAYRYSRLCRSFTYEETAARYYSLCFEPTALKTRREEIATLSDEERFDIMFGLNMNLQEASILCDIRSTTADDINVFKKVLEEHRDTFSEFRTPEVLYHFWTDLKNNQLLCDQKVTAAPTTNIVLTLSDCSDVESDDSTVRNEDMEEQTDEDDIDEGLAEFYSSIKSAINKPKTSDSRRLKRLTVARGALEHEMATVKAQIRGISMAFLMVGAEGGRIANSIVSKSVVLRAGVKAYRIKSSRTRIGIPGSNQRVDIDITDILDKYILKQYSGVLVELRRRPSGLYVLQNCQNIAVFVDASPVKRSKAVALFHDTLISIAGAVMCFELDSVCVC